MFVAIQSYLRNEILFTMVISSCIPIWEYNRLEIRINCEKYMCCFVSIIKMSSQMNVILATSKEHRKDYDAVLFSR